MNSEFIFRISLVMIGVLLLGIRIYYTNRWSRSHDTVAVNTTGRSTKFLAWSLGILGDLSIAIYIFVPRWLEFAALPIPGVFRWSGVGLGFISIPLFLWAHHSLGKEFDYPGVIKEQQTLVTRGLYRWIRHPIYASYFIWTIAFLLISANWLVGVVWLVFSFAAASNIEFEEAALTEKFGQPYRDYMRRTGRFLPRLS